MKKIVIAVPALSAILYNYNSGRDQCLKRVWNQKTDGEKMNSKMKDSRKYERPSNEELRKK